MAIAYFGLALLAAHHIVQWRGFPELPLTDWSQKAELIQRALYGFA